MFSPNSFSPHNSRLASLFSPKASEIHSKKNKSSKIISHNEWECPLLLANYAIKRIRSIRLLDAADLTSTRPAALVLLFNYIAQSRRVMVAG